MTNTSIGHEVLRAEALFEPGHTAAWALLTRFAYPWEALPHIHETILKLGQTLEDSEYEKHGEDIWIHKTATISPTAHIGSAVIIGAGTEVRHCAYIRGSALIGKGAVIGNSTEIKNAILFDNVQVPHFNYIGDSILGYKAHTGAGAITSNVKSDHSLVTVKHGGQRIETGLKKFGAILGDHVEVGCNAVLNPGTVIGKNAVIYPLSFVRGFIQENSIHKQNGEIITKK